MYFKKESLLIIVLQQGVKVMFSRDVGKNCWSLLCVRELRGEVRTEVGFVKDHDVYFTPFWDFYIIMLKE